MRYAKITEHDIANGEGIGVVLWLQGCSHRCKNCHNPNTWKWSDGHEFTQDVKLKLFFAISKPYISRITFSGGDPLYKKNRKEAIELMCEIKKIRPDIKIWLYTGYTYTELKKLNLSDVDVLVDGPFIEELKDISLPFRGSANQRLIDYRKSRKLDRVVLYNLRS